MNRSVSGNTEYKRVRELLEGVGPGDQLTFKFSGGCDDRSYPVLNIVH